MAEDVWSELRKMSQWPPTASRSVLRNQIATRGYEEISRLSNRIDKLEKDIASLAIDDAIVAEKERISLLEDLLENYSYEAIRRPEDTYGLAEKRKRCRSCYGTSEGMKDPIPHRPGCAVAKVLKLPTVKEELP
ncbi:MAG: hypothetical protein NT121_03360 [Chloroflexi bacterium]|nr:hypothetical protein [Chloroflexota bacterium]